MSLKREEKSRINWAAWVIAQKRNRQMREAMLLKSEQTLNRDGVDALECLISEFENGEFNE